MPTSALTEAGFTTALRLYKHFPRGDVGIAPYGGTSCNLLFCLLLSASAVYLPSRSSASR